MKKYFTPVISIIICVILFLSACNNDNTENKRSDTTRELVENEIEHIASDTEAEEGIGDVPLDWPEISEAGVYEEAFLENLDMEMLETIAAEFQALVEEEVEAERENPEIVLTEGWTRVFDNERYKYVLSIGEPAMKPLYWIIYKSSDAGLYEYICAYALYELSGYDFINEDGYQTWTNSKEFLERFNEKVLEERKTGVRL